MFLFKSQQSLLTGGNELMGQKTYLDEFDLKQMIEPYDIGKLLNFRGFENGIDNTNLLLETDKGKYVLRYYEKRNKEWIKYELDLLNFLKKENYPTATVFSDSEGQLLSSYRGKFFALFEFLPGHNAENPNHTDDSKEIGEIVKTVAKLNALTIGYKPINFDRRDGRNVDSCWMAAQEAASTIKDQKKRNERLSILKKELETIKLSCELPESVCHADCNHGNFLISDGKVTGVVDFDQACNASAIFDLASLIYWWAWPPERGLSLERAAVICDIYQRERPVAAIEKEHLFDCLKIVHLMGIAWGMADDDFEDGMKNLSQLDIIGREKIRDLFQ